MQRQKMKNPKAGYASDFVTLIDEIIIDARQKGVKILSDAGGMNIKGCVDSIKSVAEKKDRKG
jgi:hypothetical protein